MTICSLCDLPVSGPPLTEADLEGSFCCRGCLEVARSLEELDGVGRDAVRERASESPTREVPDGYVEAFLVVDGMHCSTCEGFVALLAERETGVRSLEASYATETARVVYDPERVSLEALPERLSGFGYEVRFPDDDHDEYRRADDRMQRLLIGGFCAMLIMPWYLFYLYPSYVGIETGILTVDSNTPVGLYFPMLVIAVLTTIVLFYTGYPTLRGAYVSLRVGQPNVDLLVSIAALSAYAYSTVALTMGSTHLYYDVSVAVIMVVSLGSYAERRVKHRATDLLSSVTDAQCHEATRLREGRTETVPLADLAGGDRLLVRPGDRLPVDGRVDDGVAAVDESVLTGESVPVTKGPGDEVIGGAVVTDAPLVVTVGDPVESTVDRIAAMLWEIQSSTPGVQRFADRLATVFVPFVLVLATVVTGYRLATGTPPASALLSGLTVLVVSCPCAMGLATPLAIASGLRDALERGIVVTNAAVFEAAPAVETLVFDKTGTITEGDMHVLELHGDPDALSLASAVERFSEHPVARAITNAADEAVPVRADGGEAHASTRARVDGEPATEHSSASAFERHPGEGVSGRVDGTAVVVGTPGLVERMAGPLGEDLESAVSTARAAGRLPVVVGYGGRARAVIVVGDRVRAEWRAVLDEVADFEVVILTGDDESATAAVRAHPAVDRVFAGVPPGGKAETVRRLGGEGIVAMVGDGTNDAPALAAADLGIAMGGGTARAADAADVVLSSGDLREVPPVFALARGTRRRIRENVGWALLYNAIAIPLAALGLINPLFAAVAMATSSLLVVVNSSRPVLEE
ncbi:heavy metal translocating P-type ATPase [Natronobiforma cellulositropha]|uniref:heavy metal translocating P-type ATPase n=1 Tax=Natronobiforma cellulositropha TaxID=1679076 RepID=UPI0021D60ACA|nr:cation-translocating P-type ATPase [Natronobiforma cellulositropha]